MKFKQTDGQNQRIERISTSHLIVGIDMAKEVHVAQATNFRGIVISKRHLTFSNSMDGFEKLRNWIRELQQNHCLQGLMIGMEPTGHYWFNLANWLVNQGADVVLVNPAATKRNKENRDNCPSKNDPKDALVIADLVSRGYYYPYSPQLEQFQRLRTLMTNREFWMEESIRFQNRIIRWLDIHFPEFFLVFPDWTCPRSLATLREFPTPSDLRNLTYDEVITRWRKHMQRAGGPRGIRKSKQLIAQAQRSVGCITALSEDKQDLQRLLEDYRLIVETLSTVNSSDKIPNISN